MATTPRGRRARRLDCTPPNTFSKLPPSQALSLLPEPLRNRVVEVLPSTLRIAPIQLHALSYAVFAALIAPFGGFFASGFKRALKLKDFGDSIPGHGGLTDRMDCQVVMAVFSYTYLSSIVGLGDVSVSGVLEMAERLPPEQRAELCKRLGSFCRGQ